MGFVRVTDPELAAQLYDAGLLYEECGYDSPRHPIPARWWGWNPTSMFWLRIMDTRWRFYVLLEE